MNAADRAISAVRSSMSRADTAKTIIINPSQMTKDIQSESAVKLLLKVQRSIESLDSYKSEISKEVGERMKRASSIEHALKVELAKAGDDIGLVTELSLSPENEELINNPLKGLAT